MNKKILVLPGDGIGPEVMEQAKRVIEKIAALYGHIFQIKEGLIGGVAYDEHGSHFPSKTKQLADSCDAILFGSVGGPIKEAELPKWRDCEKNSLLGIRQAFSFNANFRPAKVYGALSELCPLRPDLISTGVDLLIVRELLGDIYFGLHETIEQDGELLARDIAEYSESQIRSIAHIGFQAAEKRDKKLTSVDKANVLDTSRLWRKIVSEVHEHYPSVSLNHMLVDNCAMQIIKNPAQFDVLLAPNLFGDILSDAAAVLPGSLGLTPSASFNSDGFGMYEPSGGSAPDIAGRGIANPTAQILCVAMMLRYSFGLEEEAVTIEDAVEKVLNNGKRTTDIALPNEPTLSTEEFADCVIQEISIS